MPTELCQPRLPHLHSAIHSQSIEGKRPPSQLGYHNEPKASITRGLTREHVDDTEKYTIHDSAAPYSAVKLSMLLTAARLLLLFLTAACHPPATRLLTLASALATLLARSFPSAASRGRSAQIRARPFPLSLHFLRRFVKVEVERGLPLLARRLDSPTDPLTQCPLQALLNTQRRFTELQPDHEVTWGTFPLTRDRVSRTPGLVGRNEANRGQEGWGPLPPSDYCVDLHSSIFCCARVPAAYWLS